jgi:hypothetical protein
MEVMEGFQLPIDAVLTSCPQTTDGSAGRSTPVSMRFMAAPQDVGVVRQLAPPARSPELPPEVS